MKKLLSLTLVLAMMLTFASFPAVAEGNEPVKIKLFYSDNATLHFQEDWLAVKTIEETFNIDFDFEVIPIADYSTKVSTTLNVGGNTLPDVILYQDTKSENGSLALNGAFVPISDYADWMPNFNARVEEFGSQDEVNEKKLSDGKLYYMPYPLLGNAPLFLGCHPFQPTIASNPEDERISFPKTMQETLGGVALSTPVNPTANEIAEIVHHAQGHSSIVIGTYNGHIKTGQLELIRALSQLPGPIICVALRNPYDLLMLPPNVTCVAAYQYDDQSMAAVIKLLKGELQPVGKLPLQ